MILTCPDCATSYFVPDERLGPQGRRVRCHACGCMWRAAADEPLDLVVTPDGGATVADAPPTDEPAEIPAPELPKAFRARAEQQRRLRRAAAAGGVWAALGCAFVGLLGAAWLFRVEVVELVPRAAHAYAFVGAPVNPVGLEFAALRARPSAGAPGMVVISGALRNVRRRPIAAPVLQVTLLDAEGTELARQMLTVPGPAIEPGGLLGFATLAPDPDRRAADVDVIFAPEAVPESAEPAVEPAHGLRPALPPEGGPMRAAEAEPLDNGAAPGVSAPDHG